MVHILEVIICAIPHLVRLQRGPTFTWNEIWHKLMKFLQCRPFALT